MHCAKDTANLKGCRHFKNVLSPFSELVCYEIRVYEEEVGFVTDCGEICVEENYESEISRKRNL